MLRHELDWIVMKALEKDRNRRYQTADALAGDIQRYLNDEPIKEKMAGFSALLFPSLGPVRSLWLIGVDLGGPREDPIVGHPSTLAPRPSTAELLPSSKARWGPRRRQSPRSAESLGIRAASSSGMVAATYGLGPLGSGFRSKSAKRPVLAWWEPPAGRRSHATASSPRKNCLGCCR